MELAEGQVKVMGAETIAVNKLKFQRGQKQKSNISQSRGNTSNHNYGQNYQSRASSSQKQQPSHPKCKRCLRIHWDNNPCPAINWKCFACNQTGHTAKSPLCKNNIHKLEREEELEDDINTAVEEEDSLELGLLQEVTEEEQQYDTEVELYHVHTITETKEKSEGESTD
ncbi:orf iii polyprotein [Lasius niger]|uniref:Orf iii polyprotein n=1 Tax=Lasius niger TaxID=67767 RepID=A0A0J7K8L0_LASNI|nr:orf iii polyprotein [Lasius niger]